MLVFGKEHVGPVVSNIITRGDRFLVANKMPDRNSFKEAHFIMSHSFRSFREEVGSRAAHIKAAKKQRENVQDSSFRPLS